MTSTALHAALFPALFPETPARSATTLPASGGHRLHIREWGRADGIPALVLHGGPGSGASPALARFFDPARYRVICPDQRGAGRSMPRGGTDANTTQDLLDDLRDLRATLGIERWLVVGGSWGATLALLHALDAPDAVAGLLLRSTFLARAADIAWFFRQGADEAAALDLQSLASRLNDDDATTRREAAGAWARRERALSTPTSGAGAGPLDDDMLDALVDRYRVQAHYLLHGCWIAPPLLDCVADLPAVPTLLLHGTQDRVCRPEGATELHRRIAHAALEWVPDAGHDPFHPAMTAAMIGALDRYARHRRFGPADPAAP